MSKAANTIKSSHRVTGCNDCPYYSIDNEVIRAYCQHGVSVDVNTNFSRKKLVPPRDCPMRKSTSGKLVVVTETVLV